MKQLQCKCTIRHVQIQMKALQVFYYFESKVLKRTGQYQSTIEFLNRLE